MANGRNMLMANRAALMGGLVLPEGCRRVLYLQGDGNDSYINTGVYLATTKHFSIDIDFEAPAAENVYGKNLFGSNDSQGANVFYQSETSEIANIGFYLCGGYAISYQECQKGVKNNLIIDVPGSGISGTWNLNGNESAMAGRTVTNSSIAFCLFTQSYSSSRCSESRIYRCCLCIDGDKVYDAIPVVKEVNGVDTGFMYDEVSGNLFGNAASSGAFTWEEL